MIKVLRKLLHRRRQGRKNPGGFTLIELLVAIAMAGLIITPILGLVVSLLNSDRQEQVKGRSEQELQAALDYIARDLQQAVYIYDAPGVAAIQGELPFGTDANRTPVLVFWKRSFLDSDSTINHDRDTGGTPVEEVGCLERLPAASTIGKTCTGGGDLGSDRDYFVYSLVAYYLIDNRNNNPGGTWSDGMRIARWEIRDGITTPNPAAAGILPARPTGAGFNDTNNYLAYPNFAFQSFDLTSANSTPLAMNNWTSYQPEDAQLNSNLVTLVDYIDQSRFDTNADLNAPTCGANQSIVPDFTALAGAGAANLTTASFYICVPTLTNPAAGFTPPRKPIAEIYLRGNARLRMEDNATYSEGRKAFFPRSSIQVQGAGFVN